MMKDCYSFDEFGLGSQLVRDLIENKKELEDFCSGFFSNELLLESVKQQNNRIVNRSVLVSVLEKQNAHLELSPQSQKNIQLLKEKNTFTITTGHQLNLFTGPLFSVIKIAQIIAISKNLQKLDTTRSYVPVFWMASEDHDFEEINHVHLFGKKMIWENDLQKEVVAGRMKLENLTSLLTEIESLYQDEALSAILKELTEMYKSSTNLTDATRKLINYLFGKYGLVIIDGDDNSLKEIFKSILIREIENEITYNNVSLTNKKLNESGYHQQVYLRKCNLFFIHENGKRERIDQLENQKYKIGEIIFSKEKLIEMIHENPHQFSPNALLRPVYQETILPNLAYIGGAGEIAYWLQLKQLFDALELSYPLLRVRDTFFIMSKEDQEYLSELNLSLKDLKQDKEVVLKKMVQSNTGDRINLSPIKDKLNQIKEELLIKVLEWDKGLVTSVDAEFAKFGFTLDKTEAKLISAAKRKEELKNKRLIKLQQKLFPEKQLQERYDNFIPFYLKDKLFLDKLIEKCAEKTTPQIGIINL